MQLPVQETHLAAECLSLGFGVKGGRVTGAHTLRLQEQEDRLPWQCPTGISSLQPAAHLLSEHVLGSTLYTGLEDTQQLARGVRRVIRSTIWGCGYLGQPQVHTLSRADTFISLMTFTRL